VAYEGREVYEEIDALVRDDPNAIAAQDDRRRRSTCSSPT
jgi:hypothetical protein